MTQKELVAVVYKEYMEWAEETSDDIDTKTHFTPEEIVEKVVELTLLTLLALKNMED